MRRAVTPTRCRAVPVAVHVTPPPYHRVEDRSANARAHADIEGSYLVEDSLDLATCEGAATIGLELADAAARFDVVLVALGGGALASGVGHVMRELRPGTLFDLGGLVVEPSAALGVAAIVEDRERFRGLTVATIVCGSNISPDDFRCWALDHR